FPLVCPVWSSTRSLGANLAASCFQLKTRDFGTIASDGATGRRGDGATEEPAPSSSSMPLLLAPSLTRSSLPFFRPVAPSPCRPLLSTHLAPRLEHPQPLDVLPQPLVVGQPPAESELTQEVYPAQAVFLVMAQFPVELFGRIGGLDAVKTFQLVAGVGERLVEIGFGLSAKGRVEHAHLRLSGTPMGFVDL